MSEPMPPEQVDGTPAWMQHEERGSFFLLKLMSRVSLLFGRRLSRIVVYGIALYFLLTAPKARKASRSYLERVLQRRVHSCKYSQVIKSTLRSEYLVVTERFARLDLDARVDQRIIRLGQSRNYYVTDKMLNSSLDSPSSP